MASGLIGPVNVLSIPLKSRSSFPMITGVGAVARGRWSSCAAALPCGPAIQVKRATPCNTGLRRPVCWQDTESNSNAATSLGEERGIEYARESCRAQRDRPAPSLQSVPVLSHRLSAAPVAMEVPIIAVGPDPIYQNRSCGLSQINPYNQLVILKCQTTMRQTFKPP